MADPIQKSVYLNRLQAGPQAVNAVLTAVKQGWEGASIAMCLAELTKAQNTIYEMKRAILYLKNTSAKPSAPSGQ